MSAPERRPQLFLTDADFDAYGAAGRARVELRQRMLGFARRVVARLDAIGVAMEVVATEGREAPAGGEHAPSQRVLLWRAAPARADLERLDPRPIGAVLSDPAPYARHACLELEVDPTAVQVGFELASRASIDARNLRARLADAGRALELRAALEALPEQFSLGLLGNVDAEPPSEARGVEIQALRALLDRAESERRSLWIGWRLPRDVVITHAALLDEQLEDAIVALGPVYKLVAWAPDNDLLVLEREVQAARVERARLNDDERTTEWERRRAEKRRAAPAPATTHDSKRSSQRGVPTRAAREAEALRDQGEPRAESEAQSQTPAPSAVRAGPPAKRPMFRRRPPARAIDIDPSVAIDKGVRVRVLAGPFEGKVGMVQEIDGKGQARVMLGLLAMWLDARDVVASVEGKSRPVLGSSHRKPNNKP